MMTSLLPAVATTLALALPGSSDDLLGVAILPVAGDSAEQSLHQAAGENPKIDYVHQVTSDAELFQVLGKYARHGKKIDYLIIGGHGGLTKQGQYAGLKLGKESNLNRTDVDLPNIRQIVSKANAALRSWKDDGTSATFNRKKSNEKLVREYGYRLKLLTAAGGACARGARIFLYNCNAMDVAEGREMVQSLGEVLLGKEGGTILAASGKVHINWGGLWNIYHSDDFRVSADWHKIKIPASSAGGALAGRWNLVSMTFGGETVKVMQGQNWLDLKPDHSMETHVQGEKGGLHLFGTWVRAGGKLRLNVTHTEDQGSGRTTPLPSSELLEYDLAVSGNRSITLTMIDESAQDEDDWLGDWTTVQRYVRDQG